MLEEPRTLRPGGDLPERAVFGPSLGEPPEFYEGIETDLKMNYAHEMGSGEDGTLEPECINLVMGSSYLRLTKDQAIRMAAYLTMWASRME